MTLTPQGHGLGWKPSLPDLRNWQYSIEELQSVQLPATIDLRNTGFLPDIWDQGQLGSCVPHGVGAAYSYDLARQGSDHNFDPSRLFVYYNGRVLENTVDQDSGLTISDGIKALNGQGAPPSADWPYNIDVFTNKPPQKAYDDGKLREAVKYVSVNQTVPEMQAVLASGLPIVIGFTVYESFESQSVANDGIVPLPSPREQVLGGHCMLVIGYKLIGGKFYWICRNSWSANWGDAGYCYLPGDYLTNRNLAEDFWTVQQVSSPGPSPIPPVPDDNFVTLAESVSKAFDGLVTTGNLVFVRDITRQGKVIEKVWKKGGFEVGVKRFH